MFNFLHYFLIVIKDIPIQVFNVTVATYCLYKNENPVLCYVMQTYQSVLFKEASLQWIHKSTFG